MKLLQIPPDITDQVWGAVGPFLERAVLHSRGTNSTESARARIKTGHAQLWAIIEDEKPHKVVAAGLTSLVDYPTGKRAMLIELLGGESMQMWADLKPDLEKWAKLNGCALVFCWARKGWLKKLTDMRVTHYVMTKEI